MNNFHDAEWLKAQLKICSIRELAQQEKVTPPTIRYWIKKHNLPRSTITSGMLKRSAYISTYSKKYWASQINRNLHSERLIQTQAQRRTELTEAAKLNWARNRAALIAGIIRATTAAKKQKITTTLNKHWAQKRNQLASHFIARAVERHGSRFLYNVDEYTHFLVNTTMTCTNCNRQFRQTPSNHLRGSGCPYCNISQEQTDIYNSINEPAVLNDRKIISPFEIDILYEKHKLGVEYHGLFWHSHNQLESAEDIKYHQTKWLLAQKAGIQLLQFFEHEWLTKREIVLSMINYRLKRTTRIQARKLILSDNRCPLSFYDANHLYGSRQASHHLCLLDNDQIIMAASWSRHQNGYELIRMATKTGMCVQGGISRLFSHFIKTQKPSFIMTYADLRYSNADGYRALGFKELAITKPGYFYYKGHTKLSRQQCQKHKQPALLANFDPKLSESMNMFNHGFRRVWDAGNLKLQLDC